MSLGELVGRRVLGIVEAKHSAKQPHHQFVFVLEGGMCVEFYGHDVQHGAPFLSDMEWVTNYVAEWGDAVRIYTFGED
ncbi:MAG: hypothetical protein OEY63_02610 [Gemmatimonadota bacterium]|nr:hypothetical protein [Gemmatimonadota bacterium]MDH5804918.1 hypothetical protein [Gemmatimonadota bacterium]